ncbi:MAG: histidinol-phosphate transaminase [Oscillospiraceae bacterium]
MEKLWRKNLLSIKPYVAGEQPKTGSFIKLNANENPYPPSPKVFEAVRNFEPASLKKYPDADANGLKKILAQRYGLSPAQVFVGNGSDDVLALAFRAFFNSDKPLFYPDITYSFYPVWCDLLKIPYRTIPVKDDFRIDPDDYIPENGGVVIPNPNAPTSIGEGREFVEKILKYNPDSVVIIDEAYADFGKYSAVELINEYDNLLVVQTMSKSRSLAGLRVGMAMGSNELISVLEAVKNSYNSYPLDSVAQAAAAASVADEEYFRDTVGKVVKTRDRTMDRLRSMGFDVFESSTNFIFCSHSSKKAADIFGYLKNNGIYVRYFDLPRIDNYLRITVGTDEEMDTLICQLEKYFA